jgi:hypothetical protein
MTLIRSFFAACAVLCFAAVTTAALAADVTYAPGLRIGLALPPGLAPASPGFAGFQSLDKRVKVGLLELPSSVYESVEAALKSGKPLPANMQASKPEPFETAAGKGLLSVETAKQADKSARVFSLLVPSSGMTAYVTVQVEEGASNAFSDDTIKTMLASVALRSEAPVSEQLDLLPFKVTELSKFKTVRTLVPGAAVVLTDGNDDASDGQPYVLVSLLPGSPSQPDERARVAEQLASTIPGVNNARVTSAEPMRIGGIPGYETRIEATSSSGPLNIVQWLRFSGGATLRIIAGAKKDLWSESFPRFRAVRDGIEPR